MMVPRTPGGKPEEMSVLFASGGKAVSKGLTAAEGEDPRLMRAQLKLIVNSLFFTVYFNPVGVALEFFPVLVEPGYFGHVPLSHFWIVCAMHTLTCSFAYLIYRRKDAPFELRSMVRRLSWLQLLLGLTWGATAWLLWVQGDQTNNLFVILIMVSMMWANTVTRTAFAPLYAIGFSTMVTLYWLRLMTGTTVVAHVLTVVLTVWLGYILIIGASMRRNVAEMLRTRFANEDMAHQLEQARDEALGERREAENANRSKTAFLANMSHELRTPLNAILGFSDMIANQVLGQEVPQRYRGYAQDINDSGSHLLSLINDLLDVAKIESGHMEIDPRDLDAHDALATVKRLITPKITAKKQTLTVSVEPNLPTLFADERAFKQIALNLLSNANKFTPEGGRIALRCGRAPQGGILIVVEDNGIGIPAAKLGTIFQPFAQADNRYDRQVGGTGLGLALVRGLCELHGGRAWIESLEGEGARVFVYFPLAKSVLKTMRLHV